jgi:hypothetical protein
VRRFFCARGGQSFCALGRSARLAEAACRVMEIILSFCCGENAMKNKKKEESAILRCINMYDGQSEEIIEVFPFRVFHIEKFREQFAAPDEDPEFLDAYAVGPTDILFLRDYVDIAHFDFQKYAYLIETVLDDRQ